MWYVACRQNQLLEEASASMQQEQDRLQHQASSLASQLHAVLQEKRHQRRLSFDAETPVDKTLNYLQSVISVSNNVAVMFALLLYLLHYTSYSRAANGVDLLQVFPGCVLLTTSHDLTAHLRCRVRHSHQTLPWSCSTCSAALTQSYGSPLD